MALLQIDTIHVVSRSPYLVLHSRLGDYPREWLEEALASGQMFETWAHEACFAPVADLRCAPCLQPPTRRHWGLAKADKTHAAQRPHLDKLLAAHTHQWAREVVRTSSGTEGKGGAWWGWKDEKRWLEALFALGELMVARRENFHRVYDLSQRVAPAAVATPLPEWAPSANSTLL